MNDYFNQIKNQIFDNLCGLLSKKTRDLKFFFIAEVMDFYDKNLNFLLQKYVKIEDDLEKQNIISEELLHLVNQKINQSKILKFNSLDTYLKYLKLEQKMKDLSDLSKNNERKNTSKFHGIKIIASPNVIKSEKNKCCCNKFCDFNDACPIYKIKNSEFEFNFNNDSLFQTINQIPQFSKSENLIPLKLNSGNDFIFVKFFPCEQFKDYVNLNLKLTQIEQLQNFLSLFNTKTKE